MHFARDQHDLEAVLRLRFNVFNLELGEGLAESFATGMDRDRFDQVCDHLMITDAKSGCLVGTYRMQTSDVAERSGLGFYTHQEFCLEEFPREVLSNAVELGRACIAEEHRNGSALFALWRGLAAYILWSGKDYLFGCCSLTSQDPRDGRRMQRYLQRGGFEHQTLRVAPKPGFECGLASAADDDPPKVPTLFGTYLRFGAKTCGPPAIDRDFQTIDFLILLNVSRLPLRVRTLFFAGLPRRPRK